MILACRDQAKGQAALARIKHNQPDARVRLFELDLADLTKVRGCARRLNDELDGLDVLINNAGVVPDRQQFTADGFEMQFGVNYLAPVLLTHLLLPLLQQRPGRGSCTWRRWRTGWGALTRAPGAAAAPTW